MYLFICIFVFTYILQISLFRNDFLIVYLLQGHGKSLGVSLKHTVALISEGQYADLGICGSAMKVKRMFNSKRKERKPQAILRNCSKCHSIRRCALISVLRIKFSFPENSPPNWPVLKAVTQNEKNQREQSL